jgi:hypothetical protein
MRSAVIFVAGMFSGIVLLIVGVWTYVELETWLPYQTPDPKFVAHIDAIAAGKVRDRNGNPLQISKYRRWYVQGTQDGHQMIWGHWDIPDPKKYPPGIVLGHRFTAPGSIFMLGGGCSQVSVIYDSKIPNWVTAVCNAPE